MTQTPASPQIESSGDNHSDDRSLDRFARFWNIVTYLMLGGAVAYLLADANVLPLNRAVCLGLALVWGAWYTIFVAQKWRSNRPLWLQGLTFMVAIAISLVMAWLEPAFLLIAFAFYGITFGVMPIRWAIPLIVWQSLGLAVLFASYAGGFSLETLPMVGGFMLSGFFAIVFGLFIHEVIRQSREKQQIIDQLKTTREDLAQAERQAGKLEERQRLAGEIHDNLAQGFISIVMHLEAAEQTLENDPVTARQHILKARQSARDHLSEARRFLWALRPDVVTREPLSKAIERVAYRWSEETGVLAQFTISGAAVALPAPSEAILLRAVQESLANVHKHARAHRVNLTLSFMEDEVILDVQDDGVGFDVSQSAGLQAAFEHGYGLVALREQTIQLGGKLEVESSPGDGATLVVSLPVGVTATAGLMK